MPTPSGHESYPFTPNKKCLGLMSQGKVSVLFKMTFCYTGQCLFELPQLMSSQEALFGNDFLPF